MLLKKENKLKYYVVGYVFVFTLNLIKVSLITKVFDPKDLGLYAFIVTVLSYIDVLFFSWINNTIWKYIYSKDISFKNLLLAIMPIIILFVLFVGLFFYLFLAYFVPLYAGLYLLGYITVTAAIIPSIYFNYLLSQHRLKSWCKCFLLQSSISLLFLVVLIQFGTLSIRNLFISNFIFNVCFTAYLIIRYWNHIPRIGLNLFSHSNSALLSYSTLSIIVNILFTLLNNGDRFLIDYFKGKEGLGIYSQNYTLASIGLLSLIQAYNGLTMPYFNKAVINEDPNSFNSKIIENYIIIFTPVVIFLMLNSYAITNTVLGESFEGFHAIFSLTLIGIYFLGLANFFETKLKLENKVNKVIKILIASVLLNITINSLLLDKYPLTIAACATGISYLFLAIRMASLNKQLINKVALGNVSKFLFFASILYLLLHFTIETYFVFKYPVLKISLSLLAAVGVFLLIVNRRFSPLKFLMGLK